MRAVVTGSTRGLGEAIARDLAGRGWHVTVNGTTADACEALAEELGGRAVVGSVAEEATADALLAEGADLLVNNAGNARDNMLTRMTVEEFDDVVGVHLRGTWLTCRAAARAMKAAGGGAIVNVVSGTALFGNPAQSNYAAAKGGVLGLTRALSLELARAGIRVNAIAPVVRTTMIDPLVRLAGDGADELLEHFGEPAAVAPVVAALAAADVTGQVIGFDGRHARVWSHPGILREQEGLDLDGELAELQPDPLGVAVHRLMGVR